MKKQKANSRSAVVTTANPVSLTGESMAGFFTRNLEDASGRHGVKISDFTKSYVVGVLTDYSKTEAMHPVGEPDTLAMLYLKSQHAQSEERLRLLRRLGDLALCVSGFFANSLNRKVVDVDYYITMGSGAYNGIASIFERKREAEVFAELYGELASKFAALVDILNEVSESTGPQQQTTLRLYDRWLKTGSERLRKMLADQGIVASPLITRTFQ
jgi:hypothetical protein